MTEEHMDYGNASNNSTRKTERSVWEIELTISNLECMLAQMYETLNDLKAQVENMKPEANSDEATRHEANRQIAKRQTELATRFAG